MKEPASEEWYQVSSVSDREHERHGTRTSKGVSFFQTNEVRHKRANEN